MGKRRTLGNKLKTLRAEKNLTQDDIAVQFSVTRQTVSSWERGVSTPDVDMIQALSKFYGVSVEFLIVPGYSRTRDILIRNTFLLIVVSTLLVSLVYSIVYRANSDEYRNAISSYEGVCELDITQSFDKTFYQREITIVDQVDVVIDEIEYCVPITIVFGESNRNELNYEIDNISSPLGFEVLFRNGIVEYYLSYEDWILLYNFKIGVYNDDGELLLDTISKRITIEDGLVEKVIG